MWSYYHKVCNLNHCTLLYTQVYGQAGKLFPALLEMVTDHSDQASTP